MPGIELCFDRENFRMSRIGHRNMNKRDARICLFAPPRHDTHLMTGIRQQARMMTKDALHTSHNGRRRIVQECDAGHCDVSRADWIARSINTAEDQPNIDAAVGGFSPLTGS